MYNIYLHSLKTIEDIGGAMAFICWRITKNHLEDLINEGFVIEKEQVFDVFVFLIIKSRLFC
jgi:hypothetical protein